MTRSLRRVAAIALLAALPAGRAAALDVPKGKGVEAPGSAASAPDVGSAIGASATSRSSGGSNDDVGGLIDHAPGKSGKWFDVGATWETHGLLWQTQTNAGNRRLFNFAYFYASLLLTRNDRIRVRGGFYEYLLADPGESGVRATDLSLSYSHLFRLPAEFNLRATLALTAPVSFYSQRASLITAPTASISLTRSIKGFTGDLNLFGGGYWQKYSSAGGYDNVAASGGAPNAKAVFGGSIEADYAFWFHPALVIGADGYLAWLWFREVAGGAPPCQNYGYGDCTQPGFSPDPSYPKQPFQQVYGFEIFLRYSPPVFYGIKSDITVALAEGDPTLGYVSRSIDGYARFFDNYYSNFEVYGALQLRY